MADGIRTYGDLLVVASIAAAFVGVATLTDLLGTPLGTVLALVFVLVLPGYVVVASAFPRRSSADEVSVLDGTDGGRVDALERLALTLLFSLVAVTLVTLALAYTPFGITRASVVVATYSTVLVGLVVAAIRRRRVPAADRFRLAPLAWLRTHQSELGPSSSTDTALTLVVALAVVVGLSASVYAVAAPIQGETFTELYLFTENGSGEDVAADYPSSLVVGESRPLGVGVQNHEGETVTYTVVVQLQRVESTNGNSSVVERIELDRVTVTLADGETWERQRSLTPTTTGEDLRLAVLLYEGDPPATPTLENADEGVHLWVAVEAD